MSKITRKILGGAILFGMAFIATMSALSAVYVSDGPSPNPLARTTINIQEDTLIVDGSSGVGEGSYTITWKPPEGVVAYHGAVLDLKANLTTNVATGAGIDVSVGTTAQNDSDLGDTGEANIISAISVDPFTNSSSVIRGAMGTPTVVNGAAAASTLYIHFLVDDADIAAAVTGTVSGVLTILWSEVADY